MFSSGLIGLREGLEAALVVGIVVAYLVRTGRTSRLPAVWAGVGAAVALSLVAGALLTFTSRRLSFEAQEVFGGVMSIVAVGFVTWMVFWMRRAARGLRGQLEGQVETAVAGGGLGLVLVAFLAVAREGLETALFLWGAVRASGQTVAPLLGAALGLAVAVLLGWLLYRRAVRLNLATFFTWTGAGLVVVAAGVLAYGVHDLQEARVLPGLGAVALDATGVLAPSSVQGSLFKGVLSISAAPTWLELGAWLAYLGVVLPLYLRGVLHRPAVAEGRPVPARA